MHLDPDNFALIIDATPLESIDLLIQNEKKEILLSYHNKRPAQNYWFVPGERVRKNEVLRERVRRIAPVELDLEPESWTLLGAYDYIYNDNALERAGINTHYVALAYRCLLPAARSLATASRLMPSMLNYAGGRWMN